MLLAAFEEAGLSEVRRLSAFFELPGFVDDWVSA